MIFQNNELRKYIPKITKNIILYVAFYRIKTDFRMKKKSDAANWYLVNFRLKVLMSFVRHATLSTDLTSFFWPKMSWEYFLCMFYKKI